MRAIDRFQAVMAVVFFIGTLVSAWRVAVADGGDIWYVPVIMALASAAMTVGALQHWKRYRVRGPALYVPPDAAPRGPGKSRAAAARKEAQPPFEMLTGAVTGGCRSFCRFRVRDPAGIVFRGPQVPCGSFVRDRSSGRLDVDPGSERCSESSVLSDQPPPPACAGRRTILSGGRRMFSSESRRAFRFRNKGSCLFRRPIVRVRPNCPTWC